MEDLFLNILQISLTVAAVAVVLLVLRQLLHKRYPARVMCLMWLLLGIRLVLPVQLTLPQAPVTVTPHTYRMTYEAAIEETDEAPPVQWVSRAEARQAASSPETQANPAKTLSVGAILGGIWLCGALLALCLQVFAYIRFQNCIRQNARGVYRTELAEVFEREKERKKIARRVALLVLPGAECPMLVGFVRAKLLVPDENMTLQDAEYIFRHELTHYNHRDLWLKAVLLLARCMHWFNPAAYLMLRAASEDIELACDHAVSVDMSLAEKKRYGETILRSVSNQVSRRPAAMISRFSGDKESLMKRLQNLFDGRAKKRGGAFLLAVMMVLAVVGGSFAIRQDAGAISDDGLKQQLTELANEWGDAFRHRTGKPIYDMLAKDKAEQFYQNRLAMLGEIDPDGTLAGEDQERALWHIGVSSPWVDGYTVQAVDPAKMQATLVYNWHISGSPDWRTAERLTFAREGDALKVTDCSNMLFDGTEAYEDGGLVDSVDRFEQLYGNDLGLPDPSYLYALAENEDMRGMAKFDPMDPFETAVAMLHLSGGKVLDSRNYYAEDKLAGKTVSYQFADGGILNIDMVNVYDQAYIPMDWALPDGKNTRTATDLARQWARGIEYKSGQYLYPILSTENRKALVDYKREQGEDGEWYWKVGGSSPSFREWVVIDTESPDIKRVVFLAHGGGSDDYRSDGGGYVQDITTGMEKGRTVITDVQDVDVGVDTGTFTGMERFQLLFGTGLSLPTYGAETLAAFQESHSHDFLLDPTEAVVKLFGFGDTVTTEDAALSKEAAAQKNAAWQVSCSFVDGSGEVVIYLYQPDGFPFWLPRGWEVVADRPEAKQTTQEIVHLCNQWAQGFARRSGHLRYDIMSDAMQEAFLQEQGKTETGEQIWTIGYSSPWPERWAVLPEAANMTARIVYAEWDSTPMEYRRAELLHFGEEGGRLVVTDATEYGSYWINTADEFLNLYNNPLGPPQYSADDLQALGQKAELGSEYRYSDPAKAAVYFLHLQGGKAVLDNPEGIPLETTNAVVVNYTFADGELMILQMMRDVDAPGGAAHVWLPVYWNLPGRGLWGSDSKRNAQNSDLGWPEVQITDIEDLNGLPARVIPETDGIIDLMPQENAVIHYSGNVSRIDVYLEQEGGQGASPVLVGSASVVPSAWERIVVPLAIPTFPDGEGYCLKAYATGKASTLAQPDQVLIADDGTVTGYSTPEYVRYSGGDPAPRDTSAYQSADTARLFHWLRSADGAYAEGILAELDRRYRQDPEEVEAIVKTQPYSAGRTWIEHWQSLGQ
ncbi:M56 family metallopeptidase [Intestinibacillus massiliensis]|uniref:M56 family metallopeptidase n=1 Tax=Intestinibacillus massiliensis TaxID=1871029 RepID=UPI000B3566C6|nr:M56 family metallopeptidase [Intestinibacillus massiliensis]